jgi:hypothetical protein
MSLVRMLNRGKAKIEFAANVMQSRRGVNSADTKTSFRLGSLPAIRDSSVGRKIHGRNA